MEFCLACLDFLIGCIKATTEKIIPIPPNRHVIKLINDSIKIGVLTKRVFIDKGFLSPLATLSHIINGVVGCWVWGVNKS